MEQAKIGEFLKTLRKEKNITQEELAEEMLVSRRTVSRWETGSNLPDLSILVELADLYDVDLREIIDGERKTTTMDGDLKDTLLKAADYENEQKKIFLGRLRMMFVAAAVLGVVYLVLIFCREYIPIDGRILDFIEGLCVGVMIGMCVLGSLFTSGTLVDKLVSSGCGKRDK